MPHPSLDNLAYTLPPVLVTLAVWTLYTVLLIRRDWRDIGRNVSEWERSPNDR